jgi:hypothetical protein
MNTEKLRLVPVVIILAFSTLACSLTSGIGSKPTEEAPLIAPTQLDLPVPKETPIEAAQDDLISSLPDLSSMIPAEDLNGDGKIDICEAIPVEAWEMVIAQSIVGDPAPFDDPSLGKGCAFDFGKDDYATYFSYVTFASEKQFNDALAAADRAEPVTTIGDSAFLNYGADARQLWVRKGDKAVMVAIGDTENVEGMLLLAPYLLKALP